MSRCWQVPLCGLEDGLTSIQAASNITGVQCKPVFLPTTRYQESGQTISIMEATAKQFLRGTRIDVPNSIVVQINDDVSKQRALARCAELNRPLVAKRMGELHKSDSNGVLLNLNTAQQLTHAFDQMGPDSECLVEEQISNVVAELLVGIVRDPVHGFLMTVGAGGVQTELLNDTSSTLLPATKAQLAQLLRELKCFPILTGYRGKAGCNMERLLDTLLQFQEAAMAVSDVLLELEVNPLICTDNSCVAADAIMRVSDDSILTKV